MLSRLELPEVIEFEPRGLDLAENTRVNSAYGVDERHHLHQGFQVSNQVLVIRRHDLQLGREMHLDLTDTSQSLKIHYFIFILRIGAPKRAVRVLVVREVAPVQANMSGLPGKGSGLPVFVVYLGVSQQNGPKRCILQGHDRLIVQCNTSQNEWVTDAAVDNITWVN